MDSDQGHGLMVQRASMQWGSSDRFRQGQSSPTTTQLHFMFRPLILPLKLHIVDNEPFSPLTRVRPAVAPSLGRRTHPQWPCPCVETIVIVWQVKGHGDCGSESPMCTQAINSYRIEVSMIPSDADVRSEGRSEQALPTASFTCT